MDDVVIKSRRVSQMHAQLLRTKTNIKISKFSKAIAAHVKEVFQEAKDLRDTLALHKAHGKKN